MCGQAGSWSLLGGSSLCSGWHFQARSHIAPGRAQGSIKTESCREGNPSSLPSSRCTTFYTKLFQIFISTLPGFIQNKCGRPQQVAMGSTTTVSAPDLSKYLSSNQSRHCLPTLEACALAPKPLFPTPTFFFFLKNNAYVSNYTLPTKQ